MKGLLCVLFFFSLLQKEICCECQLHSQHISKSSLNSHYKVIGIVGSLLAYIYCDTFCKTYFAAKKSLPVANTETDNWLDCQTHPGCLRAEQFQLKWQRLFFENKNDSTPCLLWRQSCNKFLTKNFSLQILRHCLNVCLLHSLLLTGICTIALKYHAAWRFYLYCMYSAGFSSTVVKEFPKSYVDYCCCLEGAVETTDQFFF